MGFPSSYAWVTSPQFSRSMRKISRVPSALRFLEHFYAPPLFRSRRLRCTICSSSTCFLISHTSPGRRRSSAGGDRQVAQVSRTHVRLCWCRASTFPRVRHGRVFRQALHWRIQPRPPGWQGAPHGCMVSHASHRALTHHAATHTARAGASHSSSRTPRRRKGRTAVPDRGLAAALRVVSPAVCGDVATTEEPPEGRVLGGCGRFGGSWSRPGGENAGRREDVEVVGPCAWMAAHLTAEVIVVVVIGRRSVGPVGFSCRDARVLR
jgi:hypothetical protein